MAPDHYWIGILLIEPPCAYLISHNNWGWSSSAHDSYLVADVLTLARSTTQHDLSTKSIHTGDHGSVMSGDVVVVTPGVGRENRYAKTCPGDAQVSAEYLFPADDEHLSSEERRYIESLRRDAATLFAQTAHTSPCERLGVCPVAAHMDQSPDTP